MQKPHRGFKLASVIKLIPRNEREAKEVADALEDLAAVVRSGKVNGLMFQFSTSDGGHFHGVAGHYRSNPIEAVGAITRLKVRIIQLMGDQGLSA